MYIKNVKLENFRNYKYLDLNLSVNKNIVIGENAQGKTNLLESIYFCCFGKSFRNNNDANLIREGSDYFKIMLEFFKNGRDQEIEIIVKSEKLKQIKRNGVKLKSMKDLFGSLHIVLFNPDDLMLIKASPIDRRRFIDREISNIYPLYIGNLLEYNKVLSNRNALLKNFKSIYFSNASEKNLNVMRAQIEIWDMQLVDYGVKLLEKRFDFVRNISEFARPIHHLISNGSEFLDIYYECSLDDGIGSMYRNFVDLNFNFDAKEIARVFDRKLKETLENDIRSGVTKYGIHKDDLAFVINEFDAKRFASQGQQRTAVLAIKLAQIEVIKKLVNDYPILLLDDVMSELDPLRQSMLLKKIEHFQCVISTTDVAAIELKNFDCYDKILIKDGSLQGYAK